MLGFNAPKASYIDSCSTLRLSVFQAVECEFRIFRFEFGYSTYCLIIHIAETNHILGSRLSHGNVYFEAPSK